MSRRIHDELGVEPIINAAGTFSYLGGSLMSDDVVQAWREAARHFVDMDELLSRAGERIAQLIGVESALVTAGAASSMLLGTAAAITAKCPTFPMHGAPRDDRRFEVLRPGSHRDPYDRQIAMCGVEIVDVDDLETAEQLVTPRTVMMMSYNLYEPEGGIPHRDWLRFAKRHGLPTFLDAAADVPPLSAFQQFTDMGYDMVSFSGGKAIGGPQGAGLLVGGQVWIQRARENAFPREGVVGRVAKVSKEDIVALYKAVDLFVHTDMDALTNQCMERLRIIARQLEDLESVSTKVIEPPVANRFPHLLVEWDAALLSLAPSELKQRLWEESPRIATDRVHGTGQQGLLISAINLNPNEADVVGQRLRALLRHA